MSDRHDLDNLGGLETSKKNPFMSKVAEAESDSVQCHNLAYLLLVIILWPLLLQNNSTLCGLILLLVHV